MSLSVLRAEMNASETTPSAGDESPERATCFVLPSFPAGWLWVANLVTFAAPHSPGRHHQRQHEQQLTNFICFPLASSVSFCFVRFVALVGFACSPIAGEIPGPHQKDRPQADNKFERPARWPSRGRRRWRPEAARCSPSSSRSVMAARPAVYACAGGAGFVGRPASNHCVCVCV